MADSSETLKKTPLTSLLQEQGGKMVAFAGYEMPVQFADGVLKEHLHTRSAAGLFDVSHMGQLTIRPKSGNMAEAAQALESIIPVDILGLKTGRQRYGFLTTPQGGIIDDLMISNLENHYMLVVNAACKEADIAHLHYHLSDSCHVEELENRALVAIQGPLSETILAPLSPNVKDMCFMDVAQLKLDATSCIVARSGYTGEDGFEISISAQSARALVEKLLEHPALRPVGLGARDSLRLEAGLCLYGNDIDTTTTPIEAGLAWAIQKVRRPAGARAGGFPGADVILDQLTHNVVRKRIGLRAEGRAPIRSGSLLFASETDQTPIGHVTSGSYGPTLESPVAMGYVPSELTPINTRVYAEVRAKRLAMVVSPLPFITPNYKRH